MSVDDILYDPIQDTIYEIWYTSSIDNKSWLTTKGKAIHTDRTSAEAVVKDLRNNHWYGTYEIREVKT